MPIDMTLVGPGIAFSALAISAASLLRVTRRESSSATDSRIDERIQLKLGADIAVIKAEVQHISKSLSSNSELVTASVEATTKAINTAAETMVRMSSQRAGDREK
jgi:hypothetical protein